VLEDRRDAAEVDEDGGGGDEGDDIKALRKNAGSGGMVATVSQQTKTRIIRTSC